MTPIDLSTKSGQPQYDDNPERLARFQREIRFMQTRWGDVLQTDLCYNPNLSMRLGDYTLGPLKHSKSLRRAA